MSKSFLTRPQEMGKSPQKDSRISKIGAIVPFVTSGLMLLTIALTYYTYFYDVYKVPQIIIQIGLEKIGESTDHYIAKVTVTIKNQSKSKVDIVANQGKLFAYNCKLIPADSAETQTFLKKIQDTVKFVEKNYPNNGWEMHKNFDCTNEDMVGFYQPIHNDAWMLPDEVFTVELVTSIPKTFDMARFIYSINYSLDKTNLTSKYVTDSTGNMDYAIFLKDDKDSSKSRKLDFRTDEDKEILLKREVINSATKSELWLREDSPVTK